MGSKHLTVKKETVAEIILLVDESEKLSNRLEDVNQELRILLHSLLTGSKRYKHRLRDPRQRVIGTVKK